MARFVFRSRFFFFQAEDGIRDDLVTGVQTCALPICVLPDFPGWRDAAGPAAAPAAMSPKDADLILLNGRIATQDERRSMVQALAIKEIGRASCRERV